MTITTQCKHSLRNVGVGLVIGAMLGLTAVAAEAAFLLIAY